MLERGGALLTWQLSKEPGYGRDLPIRARRIADHRIAYLTYEGRISGDRGCVRRTDSGTVRFVTLTADTVRVRLHGERLAGLFSLTRSAGDDNWIFDRTEQPCPPR